jgi:hypothetical protein
LTTNLWIGNATAVRDTYVVTVGGTWATNDTLTITGNGKTLVTTVGSTTTVAGVTDDVAKAYSSQTATDTTSTYLPVTGGRGIPEFAESTAVSTSTTVVITATTAGKPMPTLTVSKSSASGTVSIAHTVTATGPNHWDNTANWSTGAVPVTGDDVIIDRPISILYGLGQSAVTLSSLTITPRFDGSCSLGLPVRSPYGYEEFRATELAIGATTVTITSGSGLIKINFGSVQMATTVYATGSSTDSGRQACQLRGTHASNVLNVIGTGTSNTAAYVSFAENGETATVATVRQDLGTLVIGEIGTGTVTLTTVNKNGGVLYLNCAATTVTNVSGDAYHGGSGNITTVTSYGGTWYDPTATTYTTLTLNNSAVYSADGNTATKTITNTTMNNTSSIVDTADRITFTNPITWRGRVTLSAS